MTAPRKPRDVGNGLVCASFGPGGEWLSLATVHPEAGFVELTGLPLFDPEWRGNEDAVRRFRSWMRREEHAFLHVEAGRATISTRQDAPRNGLGAVQRLVIRAPLRDRPAGIRVRVNGRLARPVLAGVREAGPPPRRPAEAKSRFKVRAGTLHVNGEGGPIIIQAWLRKGGDGAGGSAGGGSAADRSDMRLPWKVLRRRMPTAVAWIDWPGDAEEVQLDIACTFDRASDEAPDWLDTARRKPSGVEEPAPTGAQGAARPLLVPARLVKTLGRMNQRAATYTRTCTAPGVSGSERVILADHRILPASWTRDAYWQARLLLTTWGRGGHDEDERIVADHLRWLFLRCDRPDGRWARSHEADGRRREADGPADAQLYPLLELAEYVLATGRAPGLPAEASWADLVTVAWAATESAVDAATGLLPTDENAAGDAPLYQYLLSDQVLLWRTATRLASVAPTLGLDRVRLTTFAERVRAAVAAHFVTDGPLGRQWAASVNGRGGVDRYLDATDLPVALAPLWGFCKPADPVWRATIGFAFDPANPGFVPGLAGGLGSRHTPGTWTLGDIVAWVGFGLMGQQPASEAALERLTAIAFEDGMLPEAYDPDGSASVVRHWFAWPGAALGAIALEHASRATGE